MTMTPIQRLAAYETGSPIDRLPAVPVLTNTTARVIGVKVSALLRNAELTAAAQIASYRRFGYDVIRVMNDLFFMAEAMGAEVRHPDDETAYLAASAIQSEADVKRLHPALPGKAWQLDTMLTATGIVLDELGSEARVSTGVVGPFTNASHLVGANTLAKWTLKRPAVVHQLCRLSLDSALAYTSAILDLGATPSITEPMASGSVISPRAFAEFVAPYLRPLVELVHTRGKKVTLHICGDTHLIWHQMAALGADCLSIDNEVSLQAAKVSVGNRVQLMGNVPPTTVMLLGSPNDVRASVRRSIAEGHDNERGFILASGCSLPTETPFENIHAFMDAALEVGYPPKLGTTGPHSALES